MRPLLTSIGPLLPEIRAASGMSYTLAALLTALPAQRQILSQHGFHGCCSAHR
jgi:cyanate permease